MHRGDYQREKELEGGRRGKRQINGNKRRFDLGCSMHNTIDR